MGQRRRYSDDDRALALTALDANAGNLQRTARRRSRRLYHRAKPPRAQYLLQRLVRRLR